MRVPLKITYIGYTCTVNINNDNTVTVNVLELPRNVKTEHKYLKNKIFYYLQTEGFIDEYVELN